MQNYGVPHYAERIVYAYGGITSQYKYGYDNRGNLEMEHKGTVLLSPNQD